MTDALERVRKELYQLPPPEFTGMRDQRMAEARDRGDEELAWSIKKLRKPTAAAWAVNLLAAKAAKRVGSLLTLGEQLRTAQREMRGDDLRELAAQRSPLVQELAREAVELAGRADHPLSDSAREQVEQTLNAALSEPEAAHAVREGALSKPLAYSGFGLDELSTFAAARSAPTPSQHQKRASSSRRSGRDAQRDEKQQELKEARSDLERAARELSQSERELKQTQDRRRRTEQRRARLAEELADLDAEIRQYADDEAGARRRREDSQHQHSTRKKLVRRLEKKLDT